MVETEAELEVQSYASSACFPPYPEGWPHPQGPWGSGGRRSLDLEVWSQFLAKGSFHTANLPAQH